MNQLTKAKWGKEKYRIIKRLKLLLQPPSHCKHTETQFLHMSEVGGFDATPVCYRGYNVWIQSCGFVSDARTELQEKEKENRRKSWRSSSLCSPSASPESPFASEPNRRQKKVDF